MWYTQYLSKSAQKSFAQTNFLPLLPAEQQPTDGDDALTAFYVSKVKCRQCEAGDSAFTGNTSMTNMKMQVNQQLVARKSLRTVPCEELSIYSLRVTLQSLLSARDTARNVSYPIYTTKKDMIAQWRSLPGVQLGDNKMSRLIRDAHCHEAAMWFTHYLSEKGQQTFEKTNFLPLLPVQEQPTDGDDVLTAFYMSKVHCQQCLVPLVEVSPKVFI